MRGTLITPSNDGAKLLILAIYTLEDQAHASFSKKNSNLNRLEEKFLLQASRLHGIYMGDAAGPQKPFHAAVELGFTSVD